MRTLHLLIFSLFLSLTAQAALLNTEGNSGKIEGVLLPSSGAATIEGEQVKLTQIGAGLRSKKVVFVNVRVYVGQLFVSNPEKFKKSEADALNSLRDQKAAAIQLHFLRSVDAENVQKSFKEALKANDVNLDDPSIKQFLDAVAKSGEAKEGKVLTILSTKLKDGNEEISYETTTGTISPIKGPTGIAEKIFSIWLGKPTDDGITQLKKAILKN